jgi:hypothetical protein
VVKKTANIVESADEGKTAKRITLGITNWRFFFFESIETRSNTPAIRYAASEHVEMIRMHIGSKRTTLLIWGIIVAILGLITSIFIVGIPVLIAGIIMIVIWANRRKTVNFWIHYRGGVINFTIESIDLARDLIAFIQATYADVGAVVRNL